MKNSVNFLNILRVLILSLSLSAFSVAANAKGSEVFTPWDAARFQPQRDLAPESSTDWYQNKLAGALRKIIPLAENDQVDRLMRALARGLEGREIVNQILEAHRIADLGAFFLELKGRVDSKRHILSQAEEKILRIGNMSGLKEEEKRREISTLLNEIDQYRNESADIKLLPEQLAVIVHFFQWWDGRKNLLIIPRRPLYIATSTARTAVEVTRWPSIELRDHGQNLPLVPYTARESEKWTRAVQPFWFLGMKLEFLQIWSQLVNQTAGHMRYRHLEGFEFRFLFEVRRYALAINVFEARDILLAYLSNYPSSQAIAKYGMDASKWPEDQRKSLAFQILLLQHTRNRAELLKIFNSGDLPPRFPESSSTQWQKAIRSFREASRTESREKCIRAMLEGPSQSF